jgi:organic hydroperoxide reductase OsmC/OhrA
LDAARFEEAAEEAKSGCPVPRALAGNVGLQVKATLT